MSESDQWLAKYLAEHDASCPACRYSLKGLTIGRCPECNQSLQLQIGLVEPKMKLWLATVLPLAFGVGVSALLIAVISMMTVRERRIDPEFWEFVGVCSIGLGLNGVPLAGVLFWGAKLRRSKPIMRVLWCVIAWFLMVGNVIVLAVLVK